MMDRDERWTLLSCTMRVLLFQTRGREEHSSATPTHTLWEILLISPLPSLSRGRRVVKNSPEASQVELPLLHYKPALQGHSAQWCWQEDNRLTHCPVPQTGGCAWGGNLWADTNDHCCWKAWAKWPPRHWQSAPQLGSAWQLALS